MKKGIKIGAIVIVSIIALMVIVPYAFRGKIKEIVVSQGNKMLNAQFDFKSLDISLLRNFPQVSITLKEFYLRGVDQFESDTLVDAKSVTVALNIMSLMGDEGYDIRKISIDRTDVHAIVLENGLVNWDIMKPDTTQQEPTADTNSKPIRIKLNKLILSDVDIIYDDRATKTYAKLDDIEMTLSGDLGAEQTKLAIRSKIEEVSVSMGGVPYLKKALISAKINVDADLINNRFTLLDNNITLNAISADVSGWAAILKDGGYDMDIKLGTNKIGFKELLSLIPAVYAKDFETLKTSGTVSLDAWAKGTLRKDLLPAFNLALNVNDATLRYPALPKGIDAINIAATASNIGGSPDLTILNVSKLSFDMGGNPFSALLNISTPISDPQIRASANGTLNLSMIREVYPLDDMELNGLIKANVNLGGRLSYIEKEQYDKFSASGSVELSAMTLKSEDMPDVEIKNSLFTFSPQFLNLSRTTLNIGSSDITTDCRLENYMAFALKGKTLKGRLNISSNNLDLNELTGGDTQPATPDAAATESSPMHAFEVPKNIDFDMTTSLAKVSMSDLQFDNVRGQIGIHNGTIDLSNLSLNTLKGSVIANGYYSTTENKTSPKIDMSFKMNNLSFAQTFQSFVTVQKLAPIFENLKGTYSGSIAINSKLDSLMSPQMESLSGSGSLSTQDLSLSGVKAIDMIAKALKDDKLKNLEVKNLKIDFTINQGRIATKPFDIKLGGTNINLSGSTGIDQTIDYTGKVQLPASVGALGKLSTLDLKIGGTFADPKVSIDTKSMASQAISAVKEEATKKLLDEVGSKLGVDLADMQKQKEALVAAAQSAGDKLIDQAKQQATKLLENAGNKPLAKIGAKAAGEKLVKEATKTAQTLVDKATEQGDKLIEQANSKK